MLACKRVIAPVRLRTMLDFSIGLFDLIQDVPWSNPLLTRDIDRDCFEGVAP
jgi:hypothetical protein